MERNGLLKRALFGMVVLVLAFAPVGCSSGSSSSSGSDTIKVGAILSLTGPYAALGTAEKNALDLEQKRINDAGGIGGKKLEIIVEDDATDEA